MGRGGLEWVGSGWLEWVGRAGVGGEWRAGGREDRVISVVSRAHKEHGALTTCVYTDSTILLHTCNPGICNLESMSTVVPYVAVHKVHHCTQQAWGTYVRVLQTLLVLPIDLCHTHFSHAYVQREAEKRTVHIQHDQEAGHHDYLQ